MALLHVSDQRLGRKRPDYAYAYRVDEGTPLSDIVDLVNMQKGKVELIISAHGLPGYAQCARGAFEHPTSGPGITIHDLDLLAKMKGKITRIEFQCCLVARIGYAPECGGHTVAYDGNAFCYRLAQVTRSVVKASIHIQYGDSNQYCGWAGRVFTWGPKGNILRVEDFALNPSTCVDI